jgi:threonine/homoserine/homoserine lactone efflux protein
MPDLDLIIAFAAATIVLVAVPGPNLVYIITRSVSQGRRAGLVSALGVEAGTLVHVLAATLGLSALVAASPVAFAILSWGGAAYLLYLAVRALRSRGTLDLSGSGGVSTGRTFLAGLMVNVLNPKVVLFFLAFLPQFIAADAGPAEARTQMLVFGVVFFALALALDLCYALAGAALRDRLTSKPAYVAAQRYAVATVYCGLAAYAVLS